MVVFFSQKVKEIELSRQLIEKNKELEKKVASYAKKEEKWIHCQETLKSLKSKLKDERKLYTIFENEREGYSIKLIALEEENSKQFGYINKLENEILEWKQKSENLTRKLESTDRSEASHLHRYSSE